ncbi:MAG: LysR family transcriptional regulator [Oscillospiraceae bacterium]|nr:LysR family transcriptional regulator [Eubacteriales bacterium]MDY2618794.1 LysR family transcriptional regulator [Oscillospiraceae bacterium]
MNTTQIGCFLAAARFHSFSRAAEELYLTQPSVSRYIGQLEQEWEVRLFVRDGKAMALTPEGEEYYRLCLRFTKEFDDLKERHRRRHGSAALSLRYSMFPAWNVARLLYENAQQISARHPDWDISLSICQAGDLVRALREGSVDLIFTLGGVLAGQNDLATERLIDLPQIILYSRQSPLAGKSGLTPEDFAQEEFLFVPDEVLTVEMVRRQTRSVEKRYGFTPRVRLLSNTDELSLALETGQGVALMDYWSRYKSNPMLRCLAVDLPLSVVLAWRKRDDAPALRTFADETAEFFSQCDI